MVLQLQEILDRELLSNGSNVKWRGLLETCVLSEGVGNLTGRAYKNFNDWMWGRTTNYDIKSNCIKDFQYFVTKHDKKAKEVYYKCLRE